MTGKPHVFNAGPCLLPPAVIDRCVEALRDFNGTGISVLSVSHRTREWEDIMDACRALWRKLLRIPDTHETLFLGGGASLQFLYAAMNFLERKAGYLDTGVWAHKAMEAASGVGTAEAVASSADRNYCYIPKGFTVPGGLDYLHITTNNTIYGTEIHDIPTCGCPLIADMSSDILSRPVDVSRFDLIYGGAQKNAGPAGVAFAIVRKDALGRVSRRIPVMLDYKVHLDKGSMYNTPPVFAIYVMYETLRWIDAMGGVEAMQRLNREKAELLYGEIDRNTLFTGTADKADRSLMNVCFVMAPGRESLQEKFLDYAVSHDIVGIKGHRSVGGFRVSLYNACTKDDVLALVDCMQAFEALVQKQEQLKKEQAAAL